MARQKKTGRLFLRRGYWYMRWRVNGQETTKSTGIREDGKDAYKRANAMLMRETSVLRLQDRETTLLALKHMIQTTKEEIADRIKGIDRSATLANLADIFDRSAARTSYTDKQVETYKLYIASLIERYGADIAITNIDSRLADAFAANIAQGRSPNTYNKYINGLTLVWRAITPSLGLESNPWEAIPRQKLDTHVRRILTKTETDAVLTAAQGEMRVLIALGLYTGLRLGDALNLRWRNIRGNGIFTKTKKTGTNVAIPLHNKLKAIISEIRNPEDEDDDFLCPVLFQKYKTDKSAVAKKIKRVLERSGIRTSTEKINGRARPDCSFHSLRHTFVSRAIEAGVPPHIVQAVVGHSSAKMTNHYTHLSDANVLTSFQLME